MDIKYDWKITSLTKSPLMNELEDVLTNIRFDYTGVDKETGNSFCFKGSVPLEAPNEDQFKEISELKESDVIEWVMLLHPTDHMNEVIEAGILEQISPSTVEIEDLKWLKN